MESTPRLSEVSFFNVILYGLFGYFTVWAKGIVSGYSFFLLFMCVPVEYFVIYHVVFSGIEFSGWRWCMFWFTVLCNVLFLTTRKVEWLEEAETAQREHEIQIERTVQELFQVMAEHHSPRYNPNVAQQTHSFSRLENLTGVQLSRYREDLEERLSWIRRRLVGGKKVSTANNNYQSALCVICQEKSPSYQVIPCYHTCICKDCITQVGNKVEYEDDPALVEEEEPYWDEVENEDSVDEQYRDNDMFYEEAEYEPNQSLKSCPICRMNIERISFANVPLKQWTNRISLLDFHSSGTITTLKELANLFRYIQTDQTATSKLVHCPSHFYKTD